MKWIEIFLFILFGTICMAISGQNNLIIYNDSSVHFKVSIDAKLLNDSAVRCIKVLEVPNKSKEISLKLEDGLWVKKNLFFDKQNAEYTYVLVKRKNGYYLSYLGEVEMGQAADRPFQLTLPFNKNRATPTESIQTNKEDVRSYLLSTYRDSSLVDSLFTDTAFIDSLSNISTEVLFYKGKRACSGIHQNMMPLLAALKEEEFQSLRLEKSKKILYSKCFSVAQIKAICALLEFDDDKMEFIAFARSYIFDLDNLLKLEEVFALEASKKKFTQLFSH